MAKKQSQKKRPQKQKIEWRRVFVAGLAVVMALVGIYYYAVVIREAFTPAEETPALVVSPLNLLVISLCGIAVVALGVMPGWVM